MLSPCKPNQESFRLRAYNFDLRIRKTKSFLWIKFAKWSFIWLVGIVELRICDRGIKLFNKWCRWHIGLSFTEALIGNRTFIFHKKTSWSPRYCSHIYVLPTLMLRRRVQRGGRFNWYQLVFVTLHLAKSLWRGYIRSPTKFTNSNIRRWIRRLSWKPTKLAKPVPPTNQFQRFRHC